MKGTDRRRRPGAVIALLAAALAAAAVGALALAWLTSQPFPTFPLCGASRVEQVLALEPASVQVGSLITIL